MAEIEKAVRQALAELLSDSAFTHHLAEEIVDRLDGVGDKHLVTMLDEASERSSVVSEDDIQKALKS